MAEKNRAVRYKGSELIRSVSGTARDVLAVVLDPKQIYTTAETEKLTEQFLKKEVEN